ncbi:MAG: putative dienelactone hydrolase [Bradymonadia bacterium]|jgi:predicted dienelactone hydrolase
MEWELGQAGPFNVGYRAYEITYDRPDIDGTRTISVGVWYPTNDTSGPSPAYLDVFLDPIPFEDAEPAPSFYGDGYPVHVHSHGFQGYSGTSAFLMRHYASHGWLVIAPDHIGNTLLDHIDPLDNSHYFLKSIDISESLDMLEELPDGDPLRGLALTDEVIMSGHSFGTYACWSIAGATYDTEVVTAECDDLSSGPCTPEELGIFLAGELGDNRVVATVPLAGTYRASWFGDAGYESVSIPVLAMTGTEDNSNSSQSQWDRLGTVTNLTWVDLDGGCHQTFALGGCATMPMLEGFEIVNSYVLAFGRVHVLDDDSENTTGVLDGSIEVSERAALLHTEL